MALWQFSFWIIPQNREKENFQEDEILSWKNKKINFLIEDFLGGILVEKESWSKHIKQYGDIDGTCIQLRIDNSNIDEICCRLDLRTLTKEMLLDVIKFILRIKGDIYYEGDIYSADLEVIVNVMTRSEAAQFCMNPTQYFEKISNR